MTQPNTFASAVSAGIANVDDIDDWISAWHDAEDAGPELHEFLGLSLDQYARWVSHPADVKAILADAGHPVPDVTSSGLSVAYGISSSEQQSSFMNATLTGIGGERAISISITPPEGFGVSDPAAFNTMLAALFSRHVNGGWKVEIQIGNDDDQRDYAAYITDALASFGKH